MWCVRVQVRLPPMKAEGRRRQEDLSLKFIY
jgi:hypothetical protein